MNLCTEMIKIVQLCTQAFTEQTSINGRVVYFLFNLVFIENERNERNEEVCTGFRKQIYQL